MRNPHRARVCERQFLNLPGYHAGAYVHAYVEDTSELPGEYDRRPLNYDVRLELEIADCARRIALEFDIRTAGERMNSFHKVDTLIAALQAFRAGMPTRPRCTALARRPSRGTAACAPRTRRRSADFVSGARRAVARCRRAAEPEGAAARRTRG